MKFLHTSDLHIGKKLFELSMLEEQKHALEQIYNMAVLEKVDAVIIAGDVYDRAVPSTEAVCVLDEFLTRLAEAEIPVIMISGNHDCGERVAFADRILERQGLYIAGSYDGQLKDVVLSDEWGKVHFICMPFVKPAVAGAQTSAEAVEKMLSGVPMMASSATGLAVSNRYVLVTHYFVTGEQGEAPQLSDSETAVHVGGLDNVPASLFQSFCYVALGHIHKPQRIGQGNVYYCGSPVKYSFSEALQEKGVNLVEIDGMGSVTVQRRLLSPVHDMRCIRGKLADLMEAAQASVGTLESVMEQTSEAEQEEKFKGVSSVEDYLQVTLTDTEELLDPMGTLRSVYPNVLQIILDKNNSFAETEYESRLTAKRKSTAELFGAFYEMLKGEPLDEVRRNYVLEAAREAESE